MVYVVTIMLVTGYNFGVSNYLDFQKTRSGLRQSIKWLTQTYSRVGFTPSSCSGSMIGHNFGSRLSLQFCRGNLNLRK